MTDDAAPTTLSKSGLVAALQGRLREQLDALATSQRASQEGVAHEETRAEDPKDMRSTEASYLARGLADRVGHLETELARLGAFAPRSLPSDGAVALGALVCIEDDEARVSWHFLVPAGGGEKLAFDGAVVHALSPSSPLGQELLGREVDDEFELDLPRGRTAYTIVALR